MKLHAEPELASVACDERNVGRNVRVEAYSSARARRTSRDPREDEIDAG
jgi:hypothetical protein